jgi:hypothetical protein
MVFPNPRAINRNSDTVAAPESCPQLCVISPSSVCPRTPRANVDLQAHKRPTTLSQLLLIHSPILTIGDAFPYRLFVSEISSKLVGTIMCQCVERLATRPGRGCGTRCLRSRCCLSNHSTSHAPNVSCFFSSAIYSSMRRISREIEDGYWSLSVRTTPAKSMTSSITGGISKSSKAVLNSGGVTQRPSW